MNNVNEVYGSAFALAQAISASRPRRRPARLKQPVDPAGASLRGSCGRCLMGVERAATQAQWRSVVGCINGNRENCAGWEIGRGVVIREGHGPVTPDHDLNPVYEPVTECYCMATSRPPCVVCCR